MDIVQSIINVIIDDGFIGSSDAEIFQITYGENDEDDSDPVKKDVNEDIKELVHRVNLNSLVKDILEDLLLLGEYPLRLTVRDEYGVTAIVDDMDPIETVIVYEREQPLHVFERISNGYRIIPPDKVLFFCLASRKVRIKIESSYVLKKRMISEYIRVGRSAVYNAIVTGKPGRRKGPCLEE